MDSTPPEIKRITVTNVTNTTITVVVVSSDIQSGIKEYEYCVGDICKTSTTNNYTFKGLKANTNYEIKVKVRNNNYRKDKQYTDEITESTKSIKVKTKTIEKPTIKVSSTAYGTGKKVTIEYPKSGEEQINSYEINGEKTTLEKEDTTTINVTENVKIKATIELKATGEKVEEKIDIVGIYKTSPSLNVHYFKDYTSWGKTKTIEIIASDLGSGLSSKPYSYDGGKTWTNSNKRTYNKEDEVVNIVVRDKVGNKSSQTFKLDKVDVTSPEEPNISNPTTGNWTNKDFALTVSSSDKRSGLGDWYYSYDQKNLEKYKNSTGKSPFTTTNFTKERNQKVYIRVCDQVGNCSSSSTYIRIDKTVPTCTSSGGNSSWTNNSRTLIGTCSDTASGCKDNASWFINWQGNWSNLGPGTVYDNAGNSTVCPANQTVRIDKTAPTCSWSGENTTWTKDDKTIKVTGTDSGGSGMNGSYTSKSWEYKSGTTQTASLSYTVKDNAGNETVCSKEANVYVDKESPYTPYIIDTTENRKGDCGTQKEPVCFPQGKNDKDCYYDYSHECSKKTMSEGITCTYKKRIQCGKGASLTYKDSGSGVKKDKDVKTIKYHKWHCGDNTNYQSKWQSQEDYDKYISTTAFGLCPKNYHKVKIKDNVGNESKVYESIVCNLFNGCT